MTGLLGSVPVLLSILIAALMPFGVLPGSLETAFREGGWGMRLILFALLVSLWLIVDRIVMVLRSGVNAYDYMNQLKPMLQAGDVRGAVGLSQQLDRPLTRIIAAGLSRAEAGERAVQAEMDAAAYREVPEIEKRTGYLALMGNVATLMGLFGTIIGLIHSFGAVSMASTSDNATLLAAGISEAMNCTAFGLLAGIMALVAFSALNGRTQAIIDEINLGALTAFRTWKRAAQQRRGEEPAFVRKPIGAPHGQLMESVGLLKAKGHGRTKKSTFASLQLTPLIDMFIVLVIFLLLNFSATGDIVAADKNIKLPFAEKVEELERVPIISVSNMPDHPSRGIVSLEGQEVSTIAELDEDTGPDWKIVKLTTQLEHRKNRWNQTNPDKAFEGRVIIQCDQDIDFMVIKKIMYSAGLAGYGNLMFAVQKRSEKGGA